MKLHQNLHILPDLGTKTEKVTMCCYMLNQNSNIENMSIIIGWQTSLQIIWVLCMYRFHKNNIIFVKITSYLLTWVSTATPPHRNCYQIQHSHIAGLQQTAHIDTTCLENHCPSRAMNH